MKQLFTIFGNPVSHSKSPLMHNLSFAGLNIDACYSRYRLENGEMLREKFFELGLKGANVTVPHKEFAFLACDSVDVYAQKVGALNTIVRREGKLYGYNTDALGFLKSIEKYHDAKKVLFLGAGGTAQSVSMILRDAGYTVTILNRSEARLQKFEEAGFETFSFEQFVPKHYDLIINMTSAGLEEEIFPAPKTILESVIPTANACIDVIYGKETPFLKLAKSYNIPTQDGSAMLLYQGAIAFEHFVDYQYSFEEILPYMQLALRLN